MLKIYLVSSPQEQLQILQKQDLGSQTWLVADLKSKIQIQQQILSQRQAYAEVSVLRASEFWRYLQRRIFPDYQLLQQDLIQNYLKELINKNPDKNLHIQSQASYMQLLKLLAPILIHPNRNEIWEEFFKLQNKAKENLELWIKPVEFLFDQFLTNKFLIPSWLPGFIFSQESENGSFTLAQSNTSSRVWDRSLWIDLGLNIQQSEIELISLLSKYVDVNWIIPNPDDILLRQKTVPFLWAPYKRYIEENADRLFSFEDQKIKSPEDRVRPLSQQQSNQHIHCYRFSSPLAEIKHCVSQVRKWIEQGVMASDIAIIAPIIEDYWPLLETHLQTEGLPADKDSSFRLQDVQGVAQFLASVRLAHQRLDFPDLELASYKEQNLIQIRFEKFLAQFQNILEPTELENQDLFAQFTKTPSWGASDEVSLLEFMLSIGRHWSDYENWSYFERIWQDLLAQTPVDFKMQRTTWLGLLESRCSKIEIKTQQANSSGIKLLKLSESDSLKLQKRIFLGLCESNFKKNSHFLLQAQDINRLGWDFGFFLDHPEYNHLNFELAWVLTNPADEEHLLFPATDFSGQVDAPHPLWLKYGGNHELNLPEATRFDELQSECQLITEKMRRDLGEVETVNISQRQIRSLSISKIQRMRNCAFQYSAENDFNLLDFYVRDLDLDPRQKGSLQHKIFEKLINEKPIDKWTDAEILKLIDDVYNENNLEFRQGVFRDIDRNRMFKLAKKFLEFEIDYAEQFRQVKVESTELKFSFYYQISRKIFTQEKPLNTPEDFILISGAIDRIDTTDSFRIILDYKPSWSAERTYSSWFKGNFLQLAFYAWVIDKGFAISGHSQNLQKPVGGILTYTYQPFNRSRGFVPAELSGIIANKPTKTKEKGIITISEKENTYSQLEDVLHIMLDNLLSGVIKPQPLGNEEDYEKICSKCQWSEVCRAPHLN